LPRDFIGGELITLGSEGDAVAGEAGFRMASFVVEQSPVEIDKGEISLFGDGGDGVGVTREIAIVRGGLIGGSAVPILLNGWRKEHEVGRDGDELVEERGVVSGELRQTRISGKGVDHAVTEHHK